MAADIYKAGLLCVRNNRLLLCRKLRGTQLLILPGGKFEGSETALECLQRELQEELGDVGLRNPVYAGAVELEAADPGKTLRMELFRADLDGTPVAQAEIAELIWFGAHDDRALLAPSIRHILDTGIVVLSPEEDFPNMQPSPAQVPGAPCWFELATSDQKAANQFYSQLFGWSVNDSPIGEDMVYSIYQLGGRDVGAGYTLMPDMKAQGIPPHWAVYFATSNTDETAAKAAELGATVLQQPFDVFEHGRMAVVRDPEGAVFCLWQPKTHSGATAMGDINTVCWSELASREIQKASQYYVSLFGWQTKNSDNMPYIEFSAGGVPRGGLLQMDPEWEGVPAHWGIYFSVADCEATVAQIQELGGSLKHGPLDIPGVGRMAVVADPQGAAFSVIKLMM
jgi:hypothetical protein